MSDGRTKSPFNVSGEGILDRVERLLRSGTVDGFIGLPRGVRGQLTVYVDNEKIRADDLRMKRDTEPGRKM